ncbi:sigma-70 family RNA polymerase sigma factor [Lentzea sp. BCCO 10_0798]|uniref:Sigma-70 family RNA polymerase sigma factor n=1 Tax=Lentzea kristufekii TaxID=3095430 RepID=A0ABU4TZI1_9PSEU|nr:sigma-70 family RNA polymerase sigma factor [Lentzea sp. BCCO 10_0798]MDX8053725.1 sigma-70 family RNA polymerase sigma factor [Lentzea sp. BCCO 10_0798]
MPPSDISTVVARCRQSDQRAWAELIDSFRPLVWVTVRSFGLDADDAEDTCQATWTRVFQRIDVIREPDKIRAWIVTVAKREALRHVGRPKRDLPVGDGLELLELPATEATAEELLDLAAVHSRLDEAKSVLSTPQRELLDLLFSEDELSYAEISRRLRIPHGSIGPTRRRILNLLREELGVPRHLAVADTADAVSADGSGRSVQLSATA